MKNNFYRITRFSIYVFVLYLLIGCGTSKPINSEDLSFKLNSLDTLPSIVNECSGMIRIDDYFLAINDGGAGPFLYKLNNEGNDTLEVIKIDGAENVDWEAVSNYENDIVVCDFGNNLGKRTDLCIYHLNQKTYSITKKINFQYPEQKTFDNLRHNFDCEGMFLKDDNYFLFTKNRGNSFTNIYKSEVYSGDFRLVDSLEVPGSVTDVIYYKEKNIAILLCYKFGLGGFTNYVAILNVGKKDTFSMLKYFQLEHREQFETIVQVEQNKFLIASEDGMIKGGNIYELIIDGLN